MGCSLVHELAPIYALKALQYINSFQYTRRFIHILLITKLFPKDNKRFTMGLHSANILDKPLLF